MKKLLISFIVTVVLVGGMMGLLLNGNQKNTGDTSNVYMDNGKQVIEITAKGGYLPRVSTAKANQTTVIKVKTNGTFDCSSSITIPSLGYRNNLPTTGDTYIPVPPQPAGTTIKGLCSMGMYNFQVQFN